MQVVPPGSEPVPDGYIRGGGGARTDSRRVLRVLAVVVLVGMAALGVGLAVGGARNDSRVNALHDRGVPVEVSVTRCLGISSGVGMGIEYWQCRGTYSLGGRTYERVIGDSRTLLQTGEVVAAVAVPGHPDLLSLHRPPAPSGLGSYVPAIVVGSITAVWAAGLVWFRRRARRAARA